MKKQFEVTDLMMQIDLCRVMVSIASFYLF